MTQKRNPHYAQGGHLSFLAGREELLELRDEIEQQRLEAASRKPGRVGRKLDKEIKELYSLEGIFRRECQRLKATPAKHRGTAYQIVVNCADNVLFEAGEILQDLHKWESGEAWLLASEEGLEEIDRREEQVMGIREFIQTEMLRLSAYMSKSSEPEPETAEQAMEEMRRLSDALDDARKKAKDAVDYEKATGKMAAFGSAGLGLFSLLLIFSSATGFLPGLALTISVVGAIFFALAFVGASDKAKKVEEQWASPIKVWEDDLAKATSEWLKLEGIHDFSNPDMP